MLNVFPRNPKCLARVTEAPAYHVLKPVRVHGRISQSQCAPQ